MFPFPALIDATTLRNTNAGGLPFSAIFVLYFGKAEQHAGDHSADSATTVFVPKCTGITGD